MRKNKTMTSAILSICCVLLIFTSGINGYVRGIHIENNSCYGIIISLPQGEDTTNETFENSRTRYLINDLLRENISVYWLLYNFSAECKYFHNQQPPTIHSFFQGTA